jgi:hypothetical protein
MDSYSPNVYREQRYSNQGASSDYQGSPYANPGEYYDSRNSADANAGSAILGKALEEDEGRGSQKLVDAFRDEFFENPAFACSVMTLRSKSAFSDALPDIEVEKSESPNGGPMIEKVYLDKSQLPFHLGDVMIFNSDDIDGVGRRAPEPAADCGRRQGRERPFLGI